jgi:CRISPR-associated protein Csb2
MLAIEVEYLLGRAVATDASRRDLAEWPPHPSRLFSALVDALGDIAYSMEHAACESALRWLEALPPPEIAASVAVSRRSIVKHFVPINDESIKGGSSAPLVERRDRQERYFPAVVPEDPCVTFAWPQADVSEDRWRSLSALTERVPYLGHSSSIVRVTCRRQAPPRTLVPAISGERLLRVPGPGRLDRLVAVHSVRRSNTLVQPPKGREIPYGPVQPDVAMGPHGFARIVRLEGARFGVAETAWVTSRFRGALLSHLGTSTSEILTGHTADGGRATRPHIAITPLANVDGEHADGGIKGLALAIPRDAEDEDVLALDQAMSRLLELHFGARGTITVRPADGDQRASLRIERYHGPAKLWASVTPVALGRHPKPSKGLTEQNVLLKDIAAIDLPPPVDVVLQNVSFVGGAPPARQFKRGEIRSIQGRVLRHVMLRFAEAVKGPLLIGAGRHMGFGLLLPREDS